MRPRLTFAAASGFLVVLLIAFGGTSVLPADPSSGHAAVTDAGGRSPEDVTYHNRVAHIVQDKCQRCHRPTGAGPFPMMNYRQVVGRRDMIRWVLSDRIMPPWYAEPGFGPWSNDLSLSDDELADFIGWLDDGTPEGDPADGPAPRTWVDGWTLSRPPDAVVSIPEPIDIPAEGVVDYIYVYTKTDFPQDRWVQEVEVRPTAPQVTHHVEVFIESPEALQHLREAQTPEERRAARRHVANGLRHYFAATVPGQSATRYPEGMGKLLPAGAWLKFQLHYTPNGRPAIDRTQVGFVFADGPVETVVHTNSAFNTEFEIPPGAEDYEISGEYEVDRDIALLSLMPHTHLRGIRFLYEVVFPDGHVVEVLPVTRYDFNWQLNYFFETPFEVPAGSKIRATGWYDNSADNPANPDPTVAVRFGEQTWDEMMIGWFSWIER